MKKKKKFVIQYPADDSVDAFWLRQQRICQVQEVGSLITNNARRIQIDLSRCFMIPIPLLLHPAVSDKIETAFFGLRKKKKPVSTAM